MRTCARGSSPSCARPPSSTTSASRRTLVYEHRCTYCGAKSTQKTAEEGACERCGGRTIPKKIHFYGHENVGASIARRAMQRLVYPKDDVDAVAHLVAHHMRPYGYAASKDPWSDAAVRRFIRDTYLARGDRVLADVDMLLKLARADITGSAPRRRRIAEESWRSLKGRVEEIRAVDAVERLDSPLDGNDLMRHFGREPGRWIKALKDFLQNEVIEGRLARTTPKRPTSSPRPTPASTTSSERSKTVHEPDALVTTDWLADHLEDENFRVVDIRGYVKKTDLGRGRQRADYLPAREEYDEAHVPGAVYVDWTRDITDPDDPVPAQVAPPERFAALMGSLGIGDETHVVVYDHSGGQFATRLWWALTLYGHDRVSVLDGGWKKWKAEGRPTTTEVPEPEPATFTPRPRRAGGPTPRRCSRRARVVEPSFSTRATRGSTRAPWRGGRGGRATFQGPRTSTPAASSTPRAGPFSRMRIWSAGCGRRACPRTGTSPSSPTATAGSPRRSRCSRCTGSVTRTSPTTTARGTSGAFGRSCRSSVEARRVDRRGRCYNREGLLGAERSRRRMKKYNVNKSRTRNAISWLLSLVMIVAGVALIASFFLAGRLDSTATNSDDPGGFNVPKLETTEDESTTNVGPRTRPSS
jgi:rhodanese-related sulfurtransferase